MFHLTGLYHSNIIPLQYFFLCKFILGTSVQRPKIPRQMSLPEFWMSLCKLEASSLKQKSNIHTPLRDSVLLCLHAFTHACMHACTHKCRLAHCLSGWFLPQSSMKQGADKQQQSSTFDWLKAWMLFSIIGCFVKGFNYVTRQICCNTRAWDSGSEKWYFLYPSPWKETFPCSRSGQIRCCVPASYLAPGEGRRNQPECLLAP